MATRRAAALSVLLGAGIAALCAVFVGRALLDGWSEASDAVRDARLVWLLAGLGLAGVGMTLIALPWRHVLGLLGVEAPLRAIVAWYYVGEIGKYVPGGLWPIVGRGEVAARRGLDRTVAYSSVALSLGMLYLADLFVVVALLPFALLVDDEAGTGALWVLALLPFGVAALHHGVLEWARATVARLARRPIEVVIPPWRSSVLTVARYVPSWLAIGTATWCIARAVDPGAAFAPVVFAACLSWVVGFVVVPVPGGVGVREATFLAACGLDPAIAAVVAVVARLCFVAVDALGAALGAASLRGPGASTGSLSEPTR